ncbi:UDP-N-acetylglucosamine diphosphorylase/glucosamine-1-phosphate N-acetyltransferase [Geoglobus ahangari]|uniref:Bifunctional protein GlmU n=1 Tax=Geoglobus ahangari TaxID=113653 RepID=A0A0F7IE65_9EURY|nr:bifunctional sugar-1-phosphate nucleotidylyltransferase/acetyltransferase [Geoglobus ahangari]AKG91234.1 UDP-N-acetylglucosamine diphosphorylase/glucosamine-1-phosphate N-acetyltransferase [Geoglobus ahangari]
MKAVILAAGEGQRLRPFTVSKPKVMIKVGNKPILQYVVEALRDSGIMDIVMVVGYRKDRVMSHFGDGKRFGVRVEYAFQEQQLGTAHALKQAENLVSDEFIVVSGDNIIDEGTVRSALAEKNSVVYRVVDSPSKYGVIKLGRNGRIEEIVEKPEEEISYLANTGVYHFDSRIFDYLAGENDLTAVINRMIGDGIEFKAVESKGVWLDIVYPWDIPKVNELALGFRGRVISGKVESGVFISGDVVIGKGCVIRSGTYIRGPVVIGENCEIGPNAVIGPAASIGSNTVIEPFSAVENSVVGDNVRIGSGSRLESSVIDSGTRIMPGFTAVKGKASVEVDGTVQKIETGAFIGERCTIGAKVTAMPACTVGNEVEVSPLKVLSGVIPDGSKVL